MKLNKLTERMITAGLVALLVGIFIYQVAWIFDQLRKIWRETE